MQNNKIIVFSRPIGTGKTTEIQNWIDKTLKISQNLKIAGVLTPIQKGERVMVDLALDVTYPFEVSTDSDEEIVGIGKYQFLKKSFDIAKDLMRLGTDCDLFIVDEVGKLEVEFDNGFEPILSDLISAYQSGARMGYLLLVIRDTLLEKGIDKYKLQGALIVHNLSEFHL